MVLQGLKLRNLYQFLISDRLQLLENYEFIICYMFRPLLQIIRQISQQDTQKGTPYCTPLPDS